MRQNRLRIGSRNVRRALVLIVLLAGIVQVAVLAGGLVTHPDGRDFAIDHAAARALLHGRNPYDSVEATIQRELPGYRPPLMGVAGHKPLPLPNWHTPFNLLLHVPLAPLPFRVAGIIWMLVSAAAMVTAIFLTVRRLGWPADLGLAAGAIVLLLPVVSAELRYGQIQCILALLFVLAWRDLETRPTRACIWLALAIAIKLFPAFLLLPLLGARRYRPVAGALFAASGLLIGSWLVTGGHNQFFQRVAQEGGLWRLFDMNVSWQGLMAHHFANPNVAAWAGSVLLACLALRPPTGLSREPVLSAIPLMILAIPVAWTLYVPLALPWLVVGLHRSRGVPRGLFAAAALVMTFWPILSPIFVTLALILGVIAEGIPRQTSSAETALMVAQR